MKYFGDCLKKGVAIGLCFVFLLTGQTYPAHSAPISAPESKIFFDSNLLHALSVPKNWGEVSDFYETKSPPVILIQDAHAIPDAQKNIHALIRYFEKKYGVDDVAVEGSSSVLDAQFLKSFPDSKALKKVLRDYYDNGELSGAAAAAAFSPAHVYFHGIEGRDLYAEGLKFYRQALGSSTGLLENLTGELGTLNDEKKKIYPAKLLSVDQAVESFYENTNQLADLIKGLADIQAPKPGSELEAVWKEMQTSHVPRATYHEKDIEVREIAKTLEQQFVAKTPRGLPKVSPEVAQRVQKQLTAAKQQWMTGEIDTDAFALILKQVSDQAKIHIVMSPALLSGIQHQQKLQAIEGTKLFQELEDYVQDVKRNLINGNESIQALDRRTVMTRLMRKCAKLELSRSEWRELSSARLPEDYSTAAAFYQNAERREAAFFKNLFSDGSSSKPRILVSGGFHTDGIKSKLKAAGIAYVVVTPKIDRLPAQNFYRERMQGHVSWEKYFRPKNGRFKPYDAFVRATRDKLLSRATDHEPRATQDKGVERGAFNVERSSEESLRLLKSWRDQIVRDLADQNRAQDAWKYTKYLDEIIPSHGPRTTSREGVAERLSRRIGELATGLRTLAGAGKLDQTNVFNLLKGMMIADDVAGSSAWSPDELLMIPTISEATHIDAVRRSELRLLPTTLAPIKEVEIAKQGTENENRAFVELPDDLESIKKLSDQQIQALRLDNLIEFQPNLFKRLVEVPYLKNQKNIIRNNVVKTVLFLIGKDRHNRQRVEESLRGMTVYRRIHNDFWKGLILKLIVVPVIVIGFWVIEELILGPTELFGERWLLDIAVSLGVLCYAAWFASIAEHSIFKYAGQADGEKKQMYLPYGGGRIGTISHETAHLFLGFKNSLMDTDAANLIELLFSDSIQTAKKKSEFKEAIDLGRSLEVDGASAEIDRIEENTTNKLGGHKAVENYEFGAFLYGVALKVQSLWGDEGLSNFIKLVVKTRFFKQLSVGTEYVLETGKFPSSEYLMTKFAADPKLSALTIEIYGSLLKQSDREDVFGSRMFIDVLVNKFRAGQEIYFADLDTGAAEFIPVFEAYLKSLGFSVGRAMGVESFTAVHQKIRPELQARVLHGHPQMMDLAANGYHQLADGSFNLVTINNITDFDGGILKQARRILSPDGLLLVTVELTDVQSEDLDEAVRAQMEKEGFEVERIENIKEFGFPDYPAIHQGQRISQFTPGVLLIGKPKRSELRSQVMDIKRSEARAGGLRRAAVSLIANLQSDQFRIVPDKFIRKSLANKTSFMDRMMMFFIYFSITFLCLAMGFEGTAMFKNNLNFPDLLQYPRVTYALLQNAEWMTAIGVALLINPVLNWAHRNAHIVVARWMNVKAAIKPLVWAPTIIYMNQFPDRFWKQGVVRIAGPVMSFVIGFPLIMLLNLVFENDPQLYDKMLKSILIFQSVSSLSDILHGSFLLGVGSLVDLLRSGKKQRSEIRLNFKGSLSSEMSFDPELFEQLGFKTGRWGWSADQRRLTKILTRGVGFKRNLFGFKDKDMDGWAEAFGTAGPGAPQRSVILRLERPITVDGVTYDAIMIKGVLVAPGAKDLVPTMTPDLAGQSSQYREMNDGKVKLREARPRAFGAIVKDATDRESEVTKQVSFPKARYFGNGFFKNKFFNNDRTPDLGLGLMLVNAEELRLFSNGNELKLVERRLRDTFDQMIWSVIEKNLNQGIQDPERLEVDDAKIQPIRDKLRDFGDLLHQVHKEGSHGYFNLANVSDWGGQLEARDLSDFIFWHDVPEKNRFGYLLNDFTMALDSISLDFVRKPSATLSGSGSPYGSSQIRMLNSEFMRRYSKILLEEFFAGYFSDSIASIQSDLKQFSNEDALRFNADPFKLISEQFHELLSVLGTEGAMDNEAALLEFFSKRLSSAGVPVTVQKNFTELSSQQAQAISATDQIGEDTASVKPGWQRWLLRGLLFLLPAGGLLVLADVYREKSKHGEKKNRSESRFNEQDPAVLAWADQLKKQYVDRREEILSSDMSMQEKSAKYVKLADEFVVRIYNKFYELFPEMPPTAWISVGSYSRGELSWHSDMDGKILVDSAASQEQLETVNNFFTFSMMRILSHNERWHIMNVHDLTSNPDNIKPQLISEMLDARILAGSSSIDSIRIRALQEIRTDTRLRDYYVMKFAEFWDQSHRKKNGSFRNLFSRQPNLKTGAGGLREMDYARWLMKLFYGSVENALASQPIHSQYFLTREEWQKANAAHEFLILVRRVYHEEQHHNNIPKTDDLTISNQDALAKAVGIAERGEPYSLEEFLTRYRAASKHLFLFSNKVFRRSVHEIGSVTYGVKPAGERKDGVFERLNGVVLTGIELLTRSGLTVMMDSGLTKIENEKTLTVYPGSQIDPGQIPAIFEYAALNGYHINGELMDAIESARPQFVDLLKSTAYQKSARDAMSRILGLKNDGRDNDLGYILFRLHSLGILSDVWPAFEGLQDRFVEDLKHEETLDMYAISSIDYLETIEQDLGSNGMDIHAAMQSLRDRNLMRPLRAALMAQGFTDLSGDQGTLRAQAMIQNLNLPDSERDLAIWLVENKDTLATLMRHNGHKNFDGKNGFKDFFEKTLAGNYDHWNLLLVMTFVRIHFLNPGRQSAYFERLRHLIDLPESLFGTADKASIGQLKDKVEEPQKTENNISLAADEKVKVAITKIQGTDVGERVQSNSQSGDYAAKPGTKIDRDLVQMQIALDAKKWNTPGTMMILSGVLFKHRLSIQVMDVGNIKDGLLVDRFMVRSSANDLSQMPQAALDILAAKIKNDIENLMQQMETLKARMKESDEKWFDEKDLNLMLSGVIKNYSSMRYKTQVTVPTEVSFEEADGRSTWLTMKTTDRLGILHFVGRVLLMHGCDILPRSTVDTEGYDSTLGLRAFDVFEISKQGKPLKREEAAALKADLEFLFDQDEINAGTFEFLETMKSFRAFRAWQSDFRANDGAAKSLRLFPHKRTKFFDPRFDSMDAFLNRIEQVGGSELSKMGLMDQWKTLRGSFEKLRGGLGVMGLIGGELVFDDVSGSRLDDLLAMKNMDTLDHWYGCVRELINITGSVLDQMLMETGKKIQQPVLSLMPATGVTVASPAFKIVRVAADTQQKIHSPQVLQLMETPDGWVKGTVQEHLNSMLSFLRAFKAMSGDAIAIVPSDYQFGDSFVRGLRMAIERSNSDLDKQQAARISLEILNLDVSAADIMRAFWDSGLLSWLLPEFNSGENPLISDHNPISPHEYFTAQHLVKATEIMEWLGRAPLDEIQSVEIRKFMELYQQVYREIADKRNPQLLGSMRYGVQVHDLGKAASEGAFGRSHMMIGARENVPALFRRLALGDREKEIAVWIAWHHQHLNAAMRDLKAGRKTLRQIEKEFLNRPGINANLWRMLFLVSVADYLALYKQHSDNPQQLTQALFDYGTNSISSLAFSANQIRAGTSNVAAVKLADHPLRQLMRIYLDVNEALEGKENGPTNVVEEMEREIQADDARFREKLIAEEYDAEIVNRFPVWYLRYLYYDNTEMSKIGLSKLPALQEFYRKLKAGDAGEKGTSIHVDRISQNDHRFIDFWIGVKEDRPGLLALMTGVLMGNNMNIHDAVVQTLPGGVVFNQIRANSRDKPPLQSNEQYLAEKSEVVQSEISAGVDVSMKDKAKWFADYYAKKGIQSFDVLRSPDEFSRSGFAEITFSKSDMHLLESHPTTLIRIQTLDRFGGLHVFARLISEGLGLNVEESPRIHNYLEHIDDDIIVTGNLTPAQESKLKTVFETLFVQDKITVSELDQAIRNLRQARSEQRVDPPHAAAVQELKLFRMPELTFKGTADFYDVYVLPESAWNIYFLIPRREVTGQDAILSVERRVIENDYKNKRPFITKFLIPKQPQLGGVYTEQIMPPEIPLELPAYQNPDRAGISKFMNETVISYLKAHPDWKPTGSTAVTATWGRYLSTLRSEMRPFPQGLNELWSTATDPTSYTISHTVASVPYSGYPILQKEGGLRTLDLGFPNGVFVKSTLVDDSEDGILRGKDLIREAINLSRLEKRRVAENRGIFHKAPQVMWLGYDPATGRLWLQLQSMLGYGFDLSSDVWKQFPIVNKISYLIQYASFFQNMHESGLLHRDIKPENLMFNPQTGEWLVIDFGAAGKPVPSESILESTADYEAPELTAALNKGEPAIGSVQSDIFSFGKTLTALFYDGASEKWDSQVENTSLRELAHKMMSEKPEDRPENMQVVVNQLQQVMTAISARSEDRAKAVTSLLGELKLPAREWKRGLLLAVKPKDKEPVSPQAVRLPYFLKSLIESIPKNEHDSTAVVFLRAGADALYTMAQTMISAGFEFPEKNIFSVWATMDQFHYLNKLPADKQLEFAANYLRYLKEAGVLDARFMHLIFVDTDSGLASVGTEALILKTVLNQSAIREANNRYNLGLTDWNVSENGPQAEIAYLNYGILQKDEPAWNLRYNLSRVSLKPADYKRLKIRSFGYRPSFLRALSIGRPWYKFLISIQEAVWGLPALAANRFRNQMAKMWQAAEAGPKLESVGIDWRVNPDSGKWEPIPMQPYRVSALTDFARQYYEPTASDRERELAFRAGVMSGTLNAMKAWGYDIQSAGVIVESKVRAEADAIRRSEMRQSDFEQQRDELEVAVNLMLHGGPFDVLNQITYWRTSLDMVMAKIAIRDLGDAFKYESKIMHQHSPEIAQFSEEAKIYGRRYQEISKRINSLKNLAESVLSDVALTALRIEFLQFLDDGADLAGRYSRLNQKYKFNLHIENSETELKLNQRFKFNIEALIDFLKLDRAKKPMEINLADWLKAEIRSGLFLTKADEVIYNTAGVNSPLVFEEGSDSIQVRVRQDLLHLVLERIFSNGFHALNREIKAGKKVTPQVRVSVKRSWWSGKVKIIARNDGYIDPKFLDIDPRTGLPKVLSLQPDRKSDRHGIGLPFSQMALEKIAPGSRIQFKNKKEFWTRKPYVEVSFELPVVKTEEESGFFNLGWLPRPAFSSIVSASAGFVMQVIGNNRSEMRQSAFEMRRDELVVAFNLLMHGGPLDIDQVISEINSLLDVKLHDDVAAQNIIQNMFAALDLEADLYQKMEDLTVLNQSSENETKLAVFEQGLIEFYDRGIQNFSDFVAIYDENNLSSVYPLGQNTRDASERMVFNLQSLREFIKPSTNVRRNRFDLNTFVSERVKGNRFKTKARPVITSAAPTQASILLRGKQQSFPVLVDQGLLHLIIERIISNGFHAINAQKSATPHVQISVRKNWWDNRVRVILRNDGEVPAALLAHDQRTGLPVITSLQLGRKHLNHGIGLPFSQMALEKIAPGSRIQFRNKKEFWSGKHYVEVSFELPVVKKEDESGFFNLGWLPRPALASLVSASAAFAMTVLGHNRSEMREAQGEAPGMRQVVSGEAVIYEPGQNRVDWALVRPYDGPETVDLKIKNEIARFEHIAGLVFVPSAEANGFATEAKAIQARIKTWLVSSKGKHRAEYLLHRIHDQIKAKQIFSRLLSARRDELAGLVQNLIDKVTNNEAYFYLSETDEEGRRKLQTELFDLEKKRVMVRLFQKILELPFGFNTGDSKLQEEQREVAGLRRTMFISFYDEIEKSLTRNASAESVIEKMIANKAQKRIDKFNEMIAKQEDELEKLRLKSGDNEKAIKALQELITKNKQYRDKSIEMRSYLESLKDSLNQYDFVYDEADSEEEQASKIKETKTLHRQVMKDLANEPLPDFLREVIDSSILDEVRKGRTLSYAASKYLYSLYAPDPVNGAKLLNDEDKEFIEFMMRYYYEVTHGKRSRKQALKENPIVVFSSTMISNEMQYEKLLRSMDGHGRVVAIVLPKSKRADEADLRYPHWFSFAKQEGIIPILNLDLEKDLQEEVNSGAETWVDGYTGEVFHQPDAALVRKLEDRRDEYVYLNRFLVSTALENARIGGYEVPMLYDTAQIDHFNVQNGDAMSVAEAMGGQGIGLFRMEKFMSEPSRDALEGDEARLEYALRDFITNDFFQSRPGSSLIIRLFDVQDDKRPRFLLEGRTKEEVEAIVESRSNVRFYLGDSEDDGSREFRSFGKRQIRAIMAAALHQPHPGMVKILMPNVLSVEEVDAIETLIQDAQREFENDRRLANKPLTEAELQIINALPVGYMVEDTKLASDADGFAAKIKALELSSKRKRFLAIGTNDLLKSVLRDYPGTGTRDQIHPQFIRDIFKVVQSANKIGLEITIEGEWASKPQLLLAMIYGLTGDAGLRFRMVPLPEQAPYLRALIRALELTDYSTALRFDGPGNRKSAGRALREALEGQISAQDLNEILLGLTASLEKKITDSSAFKKFVKAEAAKRSELRNRFNDLLDADLIKYNEKVGVFGEADQATAGGANIEKVFWRVGDDVESELSQLIELYPNVRSLYVWVTDASEKPEKLRQAAALIEHLHRRGEPSISEVSFANEDGSYLERKLPQDVFHIAFAPRPQLQLQPEPETSPRGKPVGLLAVPEAGYDDPVLGRVTSAGALQEERGFRSELRVVSQENIRLRVRKDKSKFGEFIKTAPETILGYEIRSEKIEDLPQWIREHLGKIDNTKYTQAYLKRNIGSYIALQMKDDRPDFYVIGKSRVYGTKKYSPRYKKVSLDVAREKSEDLLKRLEGVDGFNEAFHGAPNDRFMGLTRVGSDLMIKMSDLGFDISKEVTIQALADTQTKPAGKDAYLAFNPVRRTYYMINADEKGLPIGYQPEKRSEMRPVALPASYRPGFNSAREFAREAERLFARAKSNDDFLVAGDLALQAVQKAIESNKIEKWEIALPALKKYSELAYDPTTATRDLIEALEKSPTDFTAIQTAWRNFVLLQERTEISIRIIKHEKGGYDFPSTSQDAVNDLMLLEQESRIDKAQYQQLVSPVDIAIQKIISPVNSRIFGRKQPINDKNYYPKEAAILTFAEAAIWRKTLDDLKGLFDRAIVAGRLDDAAKEKLTGLNYLSSNIRRYFDPILKGQVALRQTNVRQLVSDAFQSAVKQAEFNRLADQRRANLTPHTAASWAEKTENAPNAAQLVFDPENLQATVNVDEAIFRKALETMIRNSLQVAKERYYKKVEQAKKEDAPIPEGFDKNPVMIKVTMKDGELQVLQIQDNAGGIDPKDEDLLKETYPGSGRRQAMILNNSRRLNDTGFGLAFVWHVIHMHGGKFDIEHVNLPNGKAGLLSTIELPKQTHYAFEAMVKQGDTVLVNLPAEDKKIELQAELQKVSDDQKTIQISIKVNEEVLTPFVMMLKEDGKGRKYAQMGMFFPFGWGLNEPENNKWRQQGVISSVFDWLFSELAHAGYEFENSMDGTRNPILLQMYANRLQSGQYVIGSSAEVDSHRWVALPSANALREHPDFRISVMRKEGEPAQDIAIELSLLDAERSVYKMRETQSGIEKDVVLKGDRILDAANATLLGKAKTNKVVWLRGVPRKDLKSNARVIPISRSEMRETPFNQDDADLVRASLSNGLKRKDGGPLWLFGEMETQDTLVENWTGKTSRTFDRVLVSDKKVLVAPGYGNLPFLFHALGAKQVTGMDLDATTVAWQRLKAFDMAYRNEAPWMFVNNAAKGQPHYSGQWTSQIDFALKEPKTVPGMNFIQGDILNPESLDDEKYDLIVIPYLFGFGNGLTEVSQYDLALEKITKHLNPNGKIVLMPGFLEMEKFEALLKDDRVRYDQKDLDQIRGYVNWVQSLSQRGYQIQNSVAYPHFSLLPLAKVDAGYTILQPPAKRSEMRGQATVLPRMTKVAESVARGSWPVAHSAVSALVKEHVREWVRRSAENIWNANEKDAAVLVADVNSVGLDVYLDLLGEISRQRTDELKAEENKLVAAALNGAIAILKQFKGSVGVGLNDADQTPWINRNLHELAGLSPDITFVLSQLMSGVRPQGVPVLRVHSFANFHLPWEQSLMGVLSSQETVASSNQRVIDIVAQFGNGKVAELSDPARRKMDLIARIVMAALIAKKFQSRNDLSNTVKQKALTNEMIYFGQIAASGKLMRFENGRLVVNLDAMLEVMLQASQQFSASA